jgi:hypothetical protein
MIHSIVMLTPRFSYLLDELAPAGSHLSQISLVPTRLARFGLQDKECPVYWVSVALLKLYFLAVLLSSHLLSIIEVPCISHTLLFIFQPFLSEVSPLVVHALALKVSFSYSTMDGVHLGPLTHDIQFSEEDLKSMRSQLDPDMFPHSIVETTPVDLTLFEMDNSVEAGAPLQSIEEIEQSSPCNTTLIHPQPHTTTASVEFISSESGADIPMNGLDAGSVGLKVESVDPPLFTTVSDFDDVFTLNDPPMQAIEHRLSPQQNAISTLASPFHPQQHEPPVHFQTHQQPNQPQDHLSADATPSFCIQHNPAIAQHPLVAEHTFFNGRRRSQSVPPDMDVGMSFQRRLDCGNAVGSGRYMQGSEPHAGASSWQAQGEGWRHHPYAWQDNGRAIRGGRGPIRHHTDGGTYANPHMVNAQMPYNHPHSAPLTTPSSPTVRGPSIMHGGSLPSSLRKQNSGVRDEVEKRKGKKQKVVEKKEIQGKQNQSLDTVMFHLQSVEQLVRESVEEVRLRGGGNEEFEWYVIVDFPYYFHYLRCNAAYDRRRAFKMQISHRYRNRSHPYQQNRSQNRHQAYLKQALKSEVQIVSLRLRLSFHVTYFYRRTPLAKEKNSASTLISIFSSCRSDCNDQTPSTNSRVAQTIDMALEFYKVPCFNGLFLWEKKKLLLRFLGVSRVVMEGVLGG